jgi:hypothetical protein
VPPPSLASSSSAKGEGRQKGGHFFHLLTILFPLRVLPESLTVYNTLIRPLFSVVGGENIENFCSSPTSSSLIPFPSPPHFAAPAKYIREASKHANAFVCSLSPPPPAACSRRQMSLFFFSWSLYYYKPLTH